MLLFHLKKNACEHVYFQSILRKKLESLKQQNVIGKKLFMVELQSHVSILSAFKNENILPYN